MDQGKYTLVRDPDYGFYRIQPTPTRAEIARFYADEFYSADYVRFNDSALEVQRRDKDYWDGHFGDVCAAVAEAAGRSLAGLDVLDVGCGWGEALLYFQRQGMSPFGFDPAPEAVAHARKHGVNAEVVTDMERMDVFGGKRFDVVSLLNVLEHLADPVAVLREIRDRVLKPGGVIVIDVPNEFNDFQVAADDLHHLEQWWIAPPAHLNYFSGDSLGRLLENLGFEVKVKEASFPLEMFLLFGDKYVGDAELGRKCHEKRMAFERNLRSIGKEDVLRRFYRMLAECNLGRQVLVAARLP